jgi:2-methylaconitate cis-trans-isomerase PrpF
MQKRIPAVLMRGGTSKGLFFHEKHLPSDPSRRDRVILSAYGSPDPNRRQVDGLGGAVSTASKVAIISRSESAEYDVVYQFGQVAIDRPVVDYKSNCGNISSAVGPFAIDEGLVGAVEPITRVRIHQKNTDKLIIAEVPVKNGRFDEAGDYAIDGVPGTYSRILLRFADPGGSVTGRLLPTGHAKDEMDVPGIGRVSFSLIDAANPVVLVRAADIGLSGTEIEEIDASTEIKSILEFIRCRAAVMTGIARNEKEATQSSQAIPKIGIVAEPKAYQTIGGRPIVPASIDLTARIMSMGTLHRSFAVSGAIATAGAAMIPETVVAEMIAPEVRQKDLLHIGHPSGIIEVGAVIEADNGRYRYREAALGRTARRLMEGFVLVPEGLFG